MAAAGAFGCGTESVCAVPLPAHAAQTGSTMTSGTHERSAGSMIIAILLARQSSLRRPPAASSSPGTAAARARPRCIRGAVAAFGRGHPETVPKLELA